MKSATCQFDGRMRRREPIVKPVWICRLLLIGGLFFTSRMHPVHAEDPPGLEVHEWSVWVGESQGKGMNSVADYISAMPGLVETDRSRRRETGKQEGSHSAQPHHAIWSTT